ncbi:MAG TPA: arylesterase [Longimicrobium sp.]|nr:arylesterase [Longimicrobium sp.]
MFIVACGGDARNSPPGGGGASASPADAPASGTPARAAGSGERKIVLFVGTSLTAAMGLDPEQGYPARLQEKIDSAGLPFEVVNAGVSGEISSEARQRVEKWLVKQPFDVLVVETGANDMLRGFSLPNLERNLQAIVDTARATHPEARIVLAGMLAPPNLGADYGERFQRVYAEVAERNDLPLVPFLLDGVGGLPEMNLGDGIHPNPAGHRRVAENVWPVLEPVLRAEAAEAGGSSSAAGDSSTP